MGSGCSGEGNWTVDGHIVPSYAGDEGKQWVELLHEQTTSAPVSEVGERGLDRVAAQSWTLGRRVDRRTTHRPLRVERGRERKLVVSMGEVCGHTHTHAHTHSTYEGRERTRERARERGRESERERGEMFWVPVEAQRLFSRERTGVGRG